MIIIFIETSLNSTEVEAINSILLVIIEIPNFLIPECFVNELRGKRV